jgi:hypothetical protein
LRGIAYAPNPKRLRAAGTIIQVSEACVANSDRPATFGKISLELSSNEQSGTMMDGVYQQREGRKASLSPEAAVVERHVAEFERRVERQRQLVERAEKDKHPEMAQRGRDILKTLEHSLTIARQHLAIEIRRHGA